MHGLDLFLGMMSRQWWMAIREAPRSFVLLLAVLVSSPRAASGWQTRITGSGGGPGAALSVRADAGGDVVAAGFIDNGGASGADFAVVKLASATGTEVWRQVLVGPAANDGAAALAFDAAGNPVVVGTTSALGVDRQFTVAKLASGDGHIVWRTDPVDLQDAGGFAVTVDGAGNVVAAGDRGFTVIKLDGATGAEMWRSAPLTGAAFAVATDAHDDIVAAGTLGFFNDTFAVKLAGTTGDQIWAQGFSQLDGRLFVVVNSVDAIVGRFLPPDESLTSEVAALSLTDGTPHWKAKVPGQIFALELRPTGDVIVGSGSTASDTQTGNALVSELAATDGGQIWARMFEPGVGPEIPVPASLGLDASGNVVFAGTLAGGAAGHDLFPGFSAAKLGGADGTEAWRRSDNGAVVPGIFVVRALTLAGTSRIVVAGAGRSAPDGPTAFALLGLSANDGALDLCGDGYRDAGEQCDDGNLVGDDCCSAACHTVGRDGQGCAPATACTIEATCHGGTCSGRALPCEPCGSCDPASGCRAAFADTCRRPTATQRATLDLRKRATSRGDELTWAWTSGAATTKGDFGDPRSDSGYALCLYTTDGNRVFDVMNAPAGAGCGGGGPCWHATRKGFMFHSTRSKPDGLTSVVLKSGKAGRARIVVRGKGSNLRLPALPLSSGILVQLRRSDGAGACWDAEHDFIVHNRSDRYTARGN